MWCFLRSSTSVIFGFDYGSEYIKVGMALTGRGVHVALNQQSKRLSPSYFAFWNDSNPRATSTDDHWKVEELDQFKWSFCDSAKSHSLRFPQNTIKGIFPLTKNEHGFTRRESVALVLRHMMSTVDEGKWKPENANIVFTVEPSLPRSERFALYETVQLTNGTLTGIIDSPHAAALVYALEKAYLYKEQPKNVAFIDIGATHAWAAIFNFENGKNSPIVKQLSIANNFSLGGNHIDTRVANHLISIFEEKNNVKVTSERTKRQFLEEARRAKERLSLNDAADIKMEDIVDDYGISYTLTRSEFQSLISDLNESISNLYKEVVANANLTEVDSIELIGGTTRVPYVMQILKENAGMEKLNRTMNSDEALALGAGYIAASKSKEFILMPINMSTFCNVDVSIRTSDGDEIPIFSPRSYLTDIVEVANLTTNFTIICNGEIISSFDFIPDNETTSYNISIGFDQFSFPSIKNSSVHLIYHGPPYALSDDQMKNSSSFIHAMDSLLQYRRKYENVQNDYESLLYKVKDRLEYDNLFKRVVSPKEVSKFEKKLQKGLNWYEQNKGIAKIEDFKKRLEKINKMLVSPDHRAKELVKRAPAFDKLEKSIRHIETEIESLPEWIPKDEMKKLNKQLKETREWYESKTKAQNKLKEYDDPVVFSSEIDRKRTSIETTFEIIKLIPSPTPTPVPEPVNETKTESGFMSKIKKWFWKEKPANVSNSEAKNETETNVNQTVSTNETEEINISVETNETEEIKSSVEDNQTETNQQASESEKDTEL